MSRVSRVDRIGVVYVGDLAPARGALRAVVDPSTGFLRVGRSHIARTGPLVYGDGEREWVEYRDAAQLFAPATIASFSRIVLTSDHPEGLVTAANAREHSVGFTGSALRDGVYLDADEIVITDPRAIERARRPGGVELSIGFTAEVVRRDGVAADGTAYQYAQEDLEGNHLALVDIGRAGPACRLAMDAAITVAALHPAETVTITTSAMVATVATEAVAAEGKKTMDEKEKDTAPAAGGGEPHVGPPDHAPKHEEVKADHAALVRARVAIVDHAGKILGSVDHNADDETIMLAVVARVDGDAGIKGAGAWSPEYLRARFDAAILADERAKRVDTARQIAGIVDAFAPGHRSGQDSIDLDVELMKLNNYYRDAWKAPRGGTEAQP